MNVSPVAVNLSFLIIQLPISLISAVLLMLCAEISQNPTQKLIEIYFFGLALILTVQNMAFVFLSFFKIFDSNKDAS